LIITLTTDFGKHSQRVGAMNAVIAEIAASARVLHYAHGIADFTIASGARVHEHRSRRDARRARALNGVAQTTIGFQSGL
jgi:S-adenosylmethionine hydrolase